MEQQRILNKSCEYRGKQINRNLTDQNPQCSDKYFKCYDTDTRECVSLQGEPKPKCQEGRVDRVLCSQQWPEYPCYSDRKTCLSPDGVELVNPIADILQVCRGGIECVTDYLKSYFTNKEIVMIEQDPELQLEVLNALQSHVIPETKQLTNNSTIANIHSASSIPADTYMNKARQQLVSRTHQFRSKRAKHKSRRKTAKRKSTRRKSRRKTAKRKSTRRKSTRRKSTKRKSRRKSTRRKSTRRKTARRKSTRRKSTKRKSRRKTARRKSTRSKSRRKSTTRRSKSPVVDSIGPIKPGKIVFTGSPMLAKEYIDKNGVKSIDPTGWWASEKFDGYRAIWNGNSFVSRNGKPYAVPKWFIALMPPGRSLDGEFWMGRGNFQNCGIFRKKVPNSQEWRDADVKYTVYDIPDLQLPFEDRMIELHNIVKHQCKGNPKCPLLYTTQTKVNSPEHLDAMFNRIIKQGGEGIMIRKPGSEYEQKRSSALLKYKQFGDTECEIIGYKPGTGKYQGMLGSFECKLLKGVDKPFYVSGMDDCIRKTYRKSHPIGTIITITFNELTNDGIPRFPRYLRKRDDHDL